jgi:hypothetical protein
MTFKDWVFNTSRPADTKIEVTFAEFFNTLNFNKKAEYVVRESFQNSGDAGINSSETPVRIRVFLSGRERALKPNVAAKYFGGLNVHLKACNDLDGDWDEILNGPCEFLVIEDFETFGLTGDESAGIHSSEENHFYHFFRTAGRTDKVSGTGKMGSWGIGKFVFLMSSQVRSMFGYTIREEGAAGQSRLLLGQTSLKFHELNGSTYSNYGYFGIPTNPDELPTMPYNEEAQLSKFSEDWGLKRENETGLSIVVPYCYGLDGEALLLAVVNEFCGKILSRLLEVELDLPQIGIIKINRSNLETIIEQHSSDSEWDDVRHLVKLLLVYESIQSSRIELPTVTGGMAWNDMQLSQELREELISRIQTENVAVVRVPVSITRRNNEIESSYFDVVVQQEETSEPVYPVYFRNGLRISGKQMGKSSNSVRAVFIAGPGILDEMLTNAEGPAHTEWTATRDKFVNKYKNDSNWLTFCRSAPRRVVELARGATEENDFTSLSDLFPDPDYQPTDSTRPRKNRATGTTSSDDEIIVDQLGQIPVKLGKVKGGFSLSLDEVEVDAIQIEMAYARNRGSAFTKWNKADFLASALDTEILYGSITSKAANKIVIQVTNPEKFRVTVRGFDERRDLKVRANEAAGE